MPRAAGRPPFRRTPDQIKLVRNLAAVGRTHEDMAAVLGISAKTLRQHFKDVLKVASIEADSMVGQGLLRAATEWMQPPPPGRKPVPLTREALLAMMFWAKTRMRWTEARERPAAPESAASPDQKAPGDAPITPDSGPTAAELRAAELLDQLADGISAGLVAPASVAGHRETEPAPA